MSKLLGPSEGYVDMLDTATEANAKAEANGEKKFNPLRPSSAGKCTRELAYELIEFLGLETYEKEERSAEMQRIFGLGHHVERHLIQEFERNVKDITLKYKQQVVTFFKLEAKNLPDLNLTIEGSIDTCFWSPTTRGVADFKSKKDRFSQFFKTNWDESTDKLSNMESVTKVSDTFFWVPNLVTFLDELKDPFFEQNFVQLNGYACTDFMRERGVDHASILQSNKNDSRMREVRFAPSLEVFERTKAKFQSVVNAVDQKNIELAPKDHMLGSMKCAYCPFKRQCWPNRDATRSFYNTFPAKEWPKDTNRMGAAGKEIEELFESYTELSEAGEKAEAVEARILKQMMDKNESKIRLANGQVYIAKQLKDGIVLRRSKA